MLHCAPCITSEGYPVEAVTVLGGEGLCWYHVLTHESLTQPQRDLVRKSFELTARGSRYYQSKLPHDPGLTRLPTRD